MRSMGYGRFDCIALIFHLLLFVTFTSNFLQQDMIQTKQTVSSGGMIYHRYMLRVV